MAVAGTAARARRRAWPVPRGSGCSTNATPDSASAARTAAAPGATTTTDPATPAARTRATG